MPTTIPMTRHSARAAIYGGKREAGRTAALSYRAWDELQKLLSLDDFITVATFSATGLLIQLLAIIAGVQGVWM